MLFAHQLEQNTEGLGSGTTDVEIRRPIEGVKQRGLDRPQVRANGPFANRFAAPGLMTTMKAVVYETFGDPEVLEVQDVEPPVPSEIKS